MNQGHEIKTNYSIKCIHIRFLIENFTTINCLLLNTSNITKDTRKKIRSLKQRSLIAHGTVLKNWSSGHLQNWPPMLVKGYNIFRKRSNQMSYTLLDCRRTTQSSMSSTPKATSGISLTQTCKNKLIDEKYFTEAKLYFATITHMESKWETL